MHEAAEGAAESKPLAEEVSLLSRRLQQPLSRKPSLLSQASSSPSGGCGLPSRKAASIAGMRLTSVCPQGQAQSLAQRGSVCSMSNLELS